MQGECLPRFENKLTIDKSKTDQYGMPTVAFDAQWSDNEIAMLKDGKEVLTAILEKAGFKNIEFYDSNEAPGKGIHEMGTARMGKDPKTSMLNRNNQLHAVPNVFVTDGACMASTGTQNPSLTYMALTARAADFAFMALNKGEI
jgi:choline dehydrogenase-like flavoprotein